MPSNITINNGAATPVATTFQVSRVSGDVVELIVPTSSVYYNGMHKLVLSKRPATASNAGTKVSVKVMVPEQVIENGLPTVTWNNWSEHTFFFDKRSVQLARDHVLAYSRNILADAGIAAYIKSYAGF